MNRDIEHTKTYLIGLDLGTSAIKGVLMDSTGAILAETENKTSFIHPQEEWIETDPEQHYRNVCGIIRKLAEAATGEVAALAMAAASGNTLLTDKSGTPLMNIINWMDQRAKQKPAKALSGLNSKDVSQITGWPCISSFPLAHLAWLRENRRETFEKAFHYGMDTDWILRRFTGRWVMDHSTASTFHLQDQIAGSYHLPFLKLLGIPIEKLSPLVPSGSVVGTMLPNALLDTGLSAETIVVAGSFDHPAAARAAEITKEGQLLLSCGTSWVGFTPVVERHRIIDAEMLCDPFLSSAGGPWGGIFSVPYIGCSVDWYVDNVIALGENDKMRVFNELAAQAKPGADGLVIDLRLKPKHIEADRKNVARAVMEGAARLLSEKIQSLKTQGFHFKQAVMVGGPAKSPVWPEIVADMAGLDIATGSNNAGARGAAGLAAKAIKMEDRKWKMKHKNTISEKKTK
jgi:sugar (pentulose or hexulose) kinase